MPSPSKFSLAVSLIATGGIFYGGAWLASGMTAESASVNEPVERENYVPAPVPGLSQPGDSEAAITFSSNKAEHKKFDEFADLMSRAKR